MKRIAIIGANESITMLIKRAKELGYETHVFAWKCGDPGEEVADYFYPISINEKELILEKCMELQIDGICSITSDYAYPTVNYVARKLGLPCNSVKSEVLARNKYQMRCAFKEAGIFTPVFYEVDDKYNIGFLKEQMNFPVIVKPVDRWSSKGVTRVDDYFNFNAAVDLAIKESLNGKAIVETYIKGDEYSAEYICCKGVYKLLTITKKYTTGYPNYIETGHCQPSGINIKTTERCHKIFSKALRALGIFNGAAHIEFKIMDNKEVCIIEIGARMGGDHIGTYLTPISTGLDYIRMVIDVACGCDINFEQIYKPTKVEIKYLFNEVDYLEMEQIKNCRDKIVVKFGTIDLDFSKKVIDSSSRHGYYIYKEKY